MKRLYLIDGSGFIFRAYHSLPPLTRSDGTPTGAVYGFINMLLKLMEGTQTDYIAVIFDAGRQTFRNRLYSEYKAHRPPAPDDLIPQFPLVRQATQALGLPSIECPDFEADDIIATYACQARKAGMEVVIVSSDKDLMQLIGDQVSMFDGMKQKRIGAPEVMEKFGVAPDRVRDVLSLIGDSSDNIPGVPGIGPKTAAELIGQFGSLEGLLARISEIKQPKRRETLTQHAENARLSYQLIGLHEDVPNLPLLESLALKQPDMQHLADFLHTMEFKALLVRLREKFGAAAIPKQETAAPVFSGPACNVIRDKETLSRVIAEARHAGYCAISAELTTPYPMQADVVGLALCIKPEEAYYLPLAHLAPAASVPAQSNLFDSAPAPVTLARAPGQLEEAEVFTLLAPLLADPALLKIGHNVKDLSVLLLRRALTLNAFDDLMQLSYALDGGLHAHDLKQLAERHVGIEIATPESLTGTGKNKTPFAELAIDTCSPYASGTASLILRIWRALKLKLAEQHMLSLYETIERPLIHVVAHMEKRGIAVDTRELAALSEDFGQRMAALETEIHALAGHAFNIGSPKQLGEVLFDEMGLAKGKKSSKTGSYSTSADILEELAEEGHALPARILDWRQLSKLKSTYTDALAQQIDANTGRVHTSYALAATTTGRLSSSHPNLQNIPIRTEEGRKIRRAFIAKAGYSLISADYSQIELRLLAHIADITTLKTAFQQGADIHAITASQMFSVAPEAVNADLRRKAKTINFGIIYGISAHGLATRLGIARSEAAAYIEAYFQQYPGIKDYMERTKAFAREHGYVTTLYGRRCHVPGINDKNPNMRSFSERAAINAPLQGTAADIIKRAMIQVENALQASNARMLLQVHDELVIECPENEAPRTADHVKNVMQQAAWLSVPLTVECSVGANWGEKG